MSSAWSTGLELILNACENVLQIAVTENEKPLCFEEWRKQGRYAEILTDAIAEICRRLEIKADSFRRIACFAGPGSFTGIRLVLSVAAALRRVSRAQLASLDYLQALATSAVMARGALYPEKVFAITHARRELVHCQEFISYGPQIPAVAQGEAELITPESALQKLGAEPCLACGSGLARYPELFGLPVTGQGPKGAEDAVLLPGLVDPSLGALCLLARHGDYFPRDVEPKYVRGCDAVENLKDGESLSAVERELGKDARSEI